MPALFGQQAGKDAMPRRHGFGPSETDGPIRIMKLMDMVCWLLLSVRHSHSHRLWSAPVRAMTSTWKDVTLSDQSREGSDAPP